MADAVPLAHSVLSDGALVSVAPFAEPHPPLTVVALLAEQFAFEPPFDPLQDQFHGPPPVTGDAVPALHRLPPLGCEDTVVPFALPHTPFDVL